MPEHDDSVREFSALLAERPLRPVQIAAFLDAAGPAARVAAIRSLGRGQQRALYEGAEGFRPLSLADFVPPVTEAMTAVRHFGRNTLPAFTHFEKRFCRPAGEDARKPGELWGFNFQSLSPLTGPGYFVAREDASRAEVLVDYNRVPPERPADWPEVRPNDRGPSRLVYGFMVDTLRGVSEHVSIGSAARKGRDLGSWFVLCREA